MGKAYLARWRRDNRIIAIRNRMNESAQKETKRTKEETPLLRCLRCLLFKIRNPQSAFACRLRRDKSATCRAEAMRRRVRDAAELMTRSINYHIL